MARTIRRRGRAAGHDSDRNSNVRNAAHDLPALRVDLRPVVRDHDLRRQLGERLEPAEGPGTAHPGQSPSWAKPSAANRHRLEHHGQIYWYTLQKHKSPIRPDGVEVSRRFRSAQAVQIGSKRRGCFRFRRHGARIPGARRSQQAGFLRIEHRPGGAAARQQQYQCRWQLCGSGPAADERSHAGTLSAA